MDKMHFNSDKDYLDHCHNIIVLGGTFDPIHMGHLAIAQAANLQFKPQRVLFVPSGQSAHKRDREITDAKHRYSMTTLAVCEEPSFDISRLEINRPGPSYTIDTARELHKTCPPGAKISFLIGDDALMDILSWRDAEELLRICAFVVVPRAGFNIKAAGHKSATEYSDFLVSTYGADIRRLDGPLMDISSTGIRARFKAGQAVRGLMPKHAEVYVWQNGLYVQQHKAQVGGCPSSSQTVSMAPPPPATSKTNTFQFESAKEALRIRLSPKRYAHTMGVVTKAEELAIHYSQDITKARTAALLHDCAKEYSGDKKRALCHLWGIILDPVLDANIDLTHSLLGAESALRDFNVHDKDVYQAIRNHTTGRGNMNMLDKIIMLADYIEPYRGNWGPIKEMRSLALTDINHALILGTEYTIRRAEQAGRPIHRWSYDMLKELSRTKAQL